MTEDELIDTMCTKFQDLDEYLTSETREEITFYKYFFPYLEELKSSQQKVSSENVYFKFVRKCEAYSKYIDKIYFFPKYFTPDKIPESTISKQEVDDFIKTESFYYENPQDEITKVSSYRGVWTEFFPDRTYSKNEIHWTGNNQFKIDFVKSTNPLRKNLHQQENSHIFELMEKKDNYYLISTHLMDQGKMVLFKLYVKE